MCRTGPQSINDPLGPNLIGEFLRIDQRLRTVDIGNAARSRSVASPPSIGCSKGADNVAGVPARRRHTLAVPRLHRFLDRRPEPSGISHELRQRQRQRRGGTCDGDTGKRSAQQRRKRDEESTHRNGVGRNGAAGQQVVDATRPCWSWLSSARNWPHDGSKPVGRMVGIKLYRSMVPLHMGSDSTPRSRRMPLDRDGGPRSGANVLHEFDLTRVDAHAWIQQA